MRIVDEIEIKIKESEAGTLFFVTDFANGGNDVFISRLLSEFAEQGVLCRLAKGVYYKPVMTKFGVLMPDVQEIVKAIARRDNAQIAANLPYEQRLQLLDFLVNIAKSDGSVCSEEIAALKEVAQCMELSPKEVESMLNLSGNSLEEAYKVLEIDPSATNEEVRTAYRRLALKHHPDRVATLGEDVKKAAEEKFQQINNAKERIYKARGIK